MAVFELGIADADAMTVIAAIVTVQPAATDEEAALSPPQLANLRVQEWIRSQVEQAEVIRLRQEAAGAARTKAQAIGLWDPNAPE